MVIDNNFIKAHDRLVRVIVNQYHVANVDPEDLMQEGRIGLIEAAKRFDTSRGIQFASYASWWIRREIDRATRQYGHIVNIPINAKEAYEPITERLDKVLYVEEHEQITYADILTDGVDAEKQMIRQEEKEEFRQYISELTKREQRIIENLYGLNHKPVTTEELAKEMGTSANRIRRVHERAINKLRISLIKN